MNLQSLTMPNRLLDDSAVAAYRRDGIVFPIRVVDEAEAGRMLGRLQDIEAAHGGRLPARINQKPHLLFPWLNELVRHPRIVDAVEDVLGPDLLCWGSQFFAKNGGDPSYVSWHQDATYWGLSSPDVVTAWVAFTPSTRRERLHAGRARHAARGRCRTRTPSPRPTCSSRGQEVAVDVDENDAVDVILAPGRDVAAPRADLSTARSRTAPSIRAIGFAIRYIADAASTRPRACARARPWCAARDAHGHFDHELPPEADLHPDAVARHAAIIETPAANPLCGRRPAGQARRRAPEARP